MNYEVGASVARVRTYIMISLVASRWANHVSPVKLKQRGVKKTWNFHPFSAVVHLDQESMLVHVCTSNVEHFFCLGFDRLARGWVWHISSSGKLVEDNGKYAPSITFRKDGSSSKVVRRY